MASKRHHKGVRAQNMDKLIAAVKARECLWDRKYSGHRNRFKLERHWNELAAELGTTTLECRKKWKNLKDQYRKEIQKNQTTSDWPHFQKLSFMHNQFVAEDNEGDIETNDYEFKNFDESVKTPKQEYIPKKKFLIKKRRYIDLDMEKLIELVEAREVIWNRDLKGHHNIHKLEKSWNEIALELNVTREEARLKWKYLRDQARKEVRKHNSVWEYLPKVQFVVKHFRDYESSEEQEDPISQDYDADQGTSYYIGPAQEQIDNYYIEPTQEQKDIKIEVSLKDDDFDEFDTKPVKLETEFYDNVGEAQKTISYVNELGNPEAVIKDEDVEFFNSLLPHVRKLDPAKKLMVRMKIQEVIYNTVYS